MSNSTFRHEIPFVKKSIVVSFDGGSTSSDGGFLILRQVDRKLGLTKGLANCIHDERDQDKVEQSILDMIIQRVYGIVCGYEDCNDHDTLRSDPVFKLIAGRLPDDEALASQPTLSRFENIVTPAMMRRRVMLLRRRRNDGM